MNLPDLTVVGPAFFEVFVPPPDARPVPGEERYVDRIPVGLGGALNAASVAAALGLSVTFMHPAGDGLLDAAVRWAVGRLGVREVTWPARPDPFVSLVFSDSVDRAFLSHGDFDAMNRCPEIPLARWVHMGGIKEAFAVPLRVAAVRAAGARVCACACWSPDDLRRLAAATDRPLDLLVLNRHEAEAAAGDADLAPERLQGAAADIVVTDGERGAFGVLGGDRVHADAAPARMVDPTGAGDAFSAGLVAGLIRGLAPADALGFACRVAARVIGIQGGVVMDPAVLAGVW